MQKPYKSLRPYLLIAIITLLFSVFFFSNLLDLFNSADYPELEIPASSLSVSGEDASVNGDQITISSADTVLTFTGLNIPSKTLTIYTDAPEGTGEFPIFGSVSISDEANTPGFSSASNFSVSPAGEENAVTVRFESNGCANGFQISFEGSEYKVQPFSIDRIVINQPVSFHFSFLKFLLLFLFCSLIYLCIHEKLYQVRFDWKNRYHQALLMITMVFLLVFAVILFFQCLGSDGAFLPYPSESITNGNPYQQQFDAWMHGQVSLLTQPDPALAALTNPYNTNARAGVPYLWDFAYYNGSYFSYFGVTPLLLIYFPIYFLTGQLPADITVCTILVMVAIVFLYGLVKEMLLKFRIQPNLILYLLSMLALGFGGMVFYLQIRASVYEIAELSGIAFLLVFLCMSFRAVRAEKYSLRMIRFILAGVSFALLLGSRPNLALVAVFCVAPLFIGVLVDRSRSLKLRLTDAASFLIPAIFGCALLLFYNYIRFDSFLEFGTSYQLTVSDVSYNTVSLSIPHLINTLLYYFLFPLALCGVFPYFAFGTTIFAPEGNFLYIPHPRGMDEAFLAMGVLSIPISWLLLLAPKVIHKREALKSATIILSLVGCFLLAYADFCIGGVFFRYTCDIIIVMLIIAIIVLLDVFDKGHMRCGGGGYCLTCALCMLTIMIGFFLIFCIYSDNYNLIILYNMDTYIRIGQFFTLGC